MTAGDLRFQLLAHPDATPAHEAVVAVVSPTHHSFWQGIACKALAILRPLFTLNDEESAAWAAVEAIICSKG